MEIQSENIQPISGSQAPFGFSEKSFPYRILIFKWPGNLIKASHFITVLVCEFHLKFGAVLCCYIVVA